MSLNYYGRKVYGYWNVQIEKCREKTGKGFIFTRIFLSKGKDFDFFFWKFSKEKENYLDQTCGIYCMAKIGKLREW